MKEGKWGKRSGEKHKRTLHHFLKKTCTRRVSRLDKVLRRSSVTRSISLQAMFVAISD